MPATEYIGTEIDSQTREAAAKVLDNVGLSLSEFLRLSVAKVARDRRLPFDAEEALEEKFGEEIPNDLTRETLEKAERGEEVFYARDFDDFIRQLRS